MQLTTSGTFLSVDFFQSLIFFILPKPKSSTVGEREGWSDFQLQPNSQLILSIPLFLAGIWKQVISHSNTRNLLHNCQATPSLLAPIPCYRLQLSLAIPGYPLQLFLAATPLQPMDWGSRNLMHSLSQATVSHGAFSRLAHLLFFSLFMFTTTQPCGRGCIKVEYFGAHVLLRASALWVSNVTFLFLLSSSSAVGSNFVFVVVFLCFCVANHTLHIDHRCDIVLLQSRLQFELQRATLQPLHWSWTATSSLKIVCSYNLHLQLALYSSMHVTLNFILHPVTF